MNAIGGNPHQAFQNDLPDPTSNNMVTSAKFAINSCTFLFLGFDAMVKALSTSVSSTKIVPGLSMESNDISRLCAQLVYTSKLVEADYSQYAPPYGTCGLIATKVRYFHAAYVVVLLHTSPGRISRA